MKIRAITRAIGFSGLLLFAFGCNNTENQQATEDASDTEAMGEPTWIEYQAKDNRREKKVVLVSGDEEYRSEEALPQIGKILSQHHGFDCVVLFSQHPDAEGLIDPNHLNNIPGLYHLDDADLLILFTRFRALPDEQMQHFEKYLSAGRPVLAIRTATHAFNFKDSTHSYAHWGNYYKGEKEAWHGGFGQLVLGENWYSHHGHHKHQSTRGLVAPGAAEHPVTNGISDGDIWGSTDVYGVELPLPGDSKHIILGQVIDRAGAFDEADALFGMRPEDSQIAEVNPASKKEYNPNDPMMPIAWTKTYQLPGGSAGTAFTSTIGSSTDLLNEGVRRLLVNAAFWLQDLDVPASANVEIVGEYDPSPYSFQRSEGYWAQKNLRVSDQGL